MALSLSLVSCINSTHGFVDFSYAFQYFFSLFISFGSSGIQGICRSICFSFREEEDSISPSASWFVLDLREEEYSISPARSWFLFDVGQKPVSARQQGKKRESPYISFFSFVRSPFNFIWCFFWTNPYSRAGPAAVQKQMKHPRRSVL